MKSLLSIILFLLSLSASANMAYWGPAEGHVAGRNTSGKLRVLHEVITVDMRSLPGGKTRVFADYIIRSREEAGYMTFLFVASAENPVSPEIILDGVVQKIAVKDSLIGNFNYDNRWKNLSKDSLRYLIGLELGTDAFENQKIGNHLFSFTIFIAPGDHKLKVGYELNPTAHDKGDLRYYDFAYFLGNSFTRPLYDSIELFVMYPEGVSWNSNMPCRAENRILHCHNLAKFKGDHLWISIYKPVAAKIERGRQWLNAAHIILWVFTALCTLFLIKRRLVKGKNIRWHYLWVIPVSMVLGIAFVAFEYTFFNHFTKLYDPWLNGYFGKGYYFLAMPFIALISAACWLLMVFLYQLYFHKRRKIKESKKAQTP